MPGMGGVDQLGPAYAPQFYIGSQQQHFVWQTVAEYKDEYYLYRAGTTHDNEIVGERRPLEDAGDFGASLSNRSRVKDLTSEEIPSELISKLQSMKDVLADRQRLVAQLDAAEAIGLGEQIIKKATEVIEPDDTL